MKDLAIIGPISKTQLRTVLIAYLYNRNCDQYSSFTIVSVSDFRTREIPPVCAWRRCKQSPRCNSTVHIRFLAYLTERNRVNAIKDYFGLKCILSYHVPVQTIVSPYDANCVTPLIYPTTDLDFLFGIIVSFDLSFYFLFFWNLHTTFL